MSERTFTTKANAIRAAKSECAKIFGNVYQAYEGPDFSVWSFTPWGELRTVWTFKLTAKVE